MSLSSSLSDFSDQAMEPTPKKLKASTNTSDPMVFVHEHVRDLIFQHLNGQEVKSSFLVSSDWNRFVASSSKSGEKLKLKIDCYEAGQSDKKLREMLSIIAVNKRKYAELEVHSIQKALQSRQGTTLTKVISESLGQSLKVLHIKRSIDFIFMFLEVFQMFDNVETIVLEDVTLCDDGPWLADAFEALPFPTLKHLKLRTSSPIFFQIFSKVTTLESFFCLFSDPIDLLSFEELLVGQNDLKRLRIANVSLEKLNLFNRHRLRQVKFKLESFACFGFVFDPENAVDFFKQQTELTNVEILSFYDRELFALHPNDIYFNILRAIFALPRLATFLVDNQSLSSFYLQLELNRVTNKTVNTVIFIARTSESKLRNTFLNLFLSLKKVIVGVDDVSEVNLFDVPCQKLPMIFIDQTHFEVESLSYQPPLVNIDQRHCEDLVLNFICKYWRLRELKLGSFNWLQSDLVFSLDFWSKVLKALPAVTRLKIWNAADVSALVDLLKTHNSFTSVILIPRVSEQSEVAKQMNKYLPISWLQIQ